MRRNDEKEEGAFGCSGDGQPDPGHLLRLFVPMPFDVPKKQRKQSRRTSATPHVTRFFKTPLLPGKATQRLTYRKSRPRNYSTTFSDGPMWQATHMKLKKSDVPKDTNDDTRHGRVPLGNGKGGRGLTAVCIGI